MSDVYEVRIVDAYKQEQDYVNALAEGFEVVDRLEQGKRALRRQKQVPQVPFGHAKLQCV